jgi:hypothetical protein
MVLVMAAQIGIAKNGAVQFALFLPRKAAVVVVGVPKFRIEPDRFGIVE